MNPELAKAIKHFQSIAGLARALDVASPTVYEWVKGKRPMALERAIQIEQLTGGVARADLLIQQEDKAALIEYLRTTATTAAKPERRAAGSKLVGQPG